MPDELASALLQEPGLRVLVVLATNVARQARALHKALPAAATLMAQGLAGAALLGALQKEKSRINVQLECDGPLRGLFLDADAEGQLRGYVKNPLVEFEGAKGAYHWRPALGNKGYLSVLRDLGKGEYYRSSVELRHFDIARDLEEYFKVSEQVESAVLLEVVHSKEEGLAQVAGVLVQTLPDGDRDILRQLVDRLRTSDALGKALRDSPPQGAMSLMHSLFGRDDLEVMARFPLSYSCGCSREGVLRALLAMGKAELEDVLAKEKKADATCQFCLTHYEIGEDEIRALLSEST